jgi:hypothetical protein
MYGGLKGQDGQAVGECHDGKLRRQSQRNVKLPVFSPLF